jgi:outer membrane immunogenic protein
VSSSAKIDWLASLRARLGAVFDPQWMGYVTGGVAFADINFSGDAQCNPAVCAPGSRSPVSNSDTKFGWVIGAGLEYRLTANWLLGAEYLFYRFDGETLTSPLRNFTTGAPAGFGACAVGAACIAYNWSDMDIHVVRARLSYKF